MRRSQYYADLVALNSFQYLTDHPLVAPSQAPTPSPMASSNPLPNQKKSTPNPIPQPPYPYQYTPKA